ncbi:MAG: hypothetical protein CVT66_02295 [Actinobacteria bacterium HGW-Actinobacteria-6]|nr:MAG: hypothetical protein CVT66_02295 [Actinobacteria bacterium HGW-Actinobacteria-6]
MTLGIRSMRMRLLWGFAAGLAIFTSTHVLFPVVLGTSGAVPVWIPGGIAMAAIMASGLVAVPFIVLGIFAGGLGVVSPAVALATAAIGITGPITFRILLRRLRGRQFSLDSVSDALVFTFAASVGSAVPSAIGIAAAGLLGQTLTSHMGSVLFWWLAIAAATLAIAPAALVWHKSERVGRMFPDAIVTTAVMVGLSWWTFSTHLPVPVERVVPFLYMPFFTFIAYRGGRRLMSVAVAAQAIIATIGTLNGYGPFASPVMHESMLALNLVIAVFAFSSLVLVLLFEERARLTRIAEESRVDLEKRVTERTAALTLANESLMQQVTERRRAEAELAERELSFRLLYERAPLAYQSLDESGNLLDVNDAWLELLGYSRGEVLGVYFGDFLDAIEADLFRARFAGFKKSGSVEGAQFGLRAKDDTVRQVAVYGRIAQTEDGRIQRTHCILQDVTALNQEVDALRASEEHFAGLFENSHTIMTLMDPTTGRFVDVNAAACDFYGMTHDEFITHDLMYLNGVDPEEMVARLVEIAAGQGGIRIDRQTLPNGQKRVLEIHSGPVGGRDRPLLFSTIQDVSDRVAAEQELVEHRERLSELVYERTAQLERTYAELETAGAAKDRFLANMSHELRTPLNSIIGFSDMLLSGLVGELDAEHDKQISMINNSGKHLLELVNDVLDVSRIDSGHARVEPEEFELAPLLESVLESVRPEAEGKGLALRLENATPIELVSSDRRKVRQVLLNLVGNAIKFTDRGDVTLRVGCDGRDTIAFVVSDTGLGISPEEIDRVFEEFHQVAPPEETKPSGTGLGLPISLRLARILGGDLVVSSTVGVGSTFTFSLPAVVCYAEALER